MVTWFSDLRKMVNRADISDQFRKVIMGSKRIGYNINVMRQSACFVVIPTTVNYFFPLKLHAGWSCIRLSDAPNIKLVDLFNLVGTGRSHVFCLVIRGSTGGFPLLKYCSDVVSHPRVQVSQ